MRASIFIVVVREQHERAIDALLDLGVRNVATFGSLSQEVIARIVSRGGRVVQLEGVVAVADKLRLQEEAEVRAARVGSLMRLRATPIAIPQEPALVSADDCARALSRSLVERLASTAILVESLDVLARDWDLRGVVVSEDYSRDARALLQWARRARVRSFHIHHGANLGRVWGIYADLFADFALLTGQRGVEGYLDAGIDAGRLAIVGSIAWDGYPALIKERSAVRAALRAQLGLPPQSTLVTFAVTTIEQGSALADVEVKRRTLQAFLRGAKAARDRGGQFTVIVKDRLYSGKSGGALVDELAAQAGISAVHVEGRPEALVCASDVIVASESNICIEAALCEVPAINLWSPVAWINGPGYTASDGIPLVPYDRPELLGEAIDVLLRDPAERARIVDRERAVLDSTVFMPDGNAAQRAAAFIYERSNAGRV